MVRVNGYKGRLAKELATADLQYNDDIWLCVLKAASEWMAANYKGKYTFEFVFRNRSTCWIDLNHAMFVLPYDCISGRVDDLALRLEQVIYATS